MKSILLFSAGKESIYCLHVRKPDLLIHFNYGQLAYEKELASLDYYANKFQVPCITLRLDENILNPPSGIVRGVGIDHVPMRNMLFLSVAANYAVTYGYGEVLFGAVNSPTYSDGDVSFAEDVHAIFNRLYGLKISAPTGTLAQDRVAHELIKQDMDLTHFWSCNGAGSEPCGVCAKCRGYTVEWANLEKPTKYQRLFHQRYTTFK